MRYGSHQIKVPEQYIGASMWVVGFFGEQVEIRCGTQMIGAHELCISATMPYQLFAAA